MKIKRRLLTTIFHILLLSSIITGCATPYKKLGKNGGYTDEKINDRVYKVSFQGNTHTSDEKVYKYFLRRSAEIALSHHFPYFLVIESEDITKFVTVTTEGTPQTKKKITGISYSGMGKTAFVPTEQKNIKKHLIEGKIALFQEGEQPANALSVEEILKDTKD